MGQCHICNPESDHDSLFAKKVFQIIHNNGKMTQPFLANHVIVNLWLEKVGQPKIARTDDGRRG